MSLTKQEIEIQKLIDSHTWTFAKTMPHIPHWYTLRANWKDSDYLEFFKAVQIHGLLYRWNNTYPKRYLFLNGYIYWCMTTDTSVSKLINRQAHNDKNMESLFPVCD